MERLTLDRIKNWPVVRLVPERFHKYFQNLSWLLFEKVFTLFVAMIVGIYVARYLQPERYGLLNYAISFVGIFSIFSTLGLDQIIVRELAKSPEQQDDLLGTGFGLKMLGAILLLVLLMLVLTVMGNDRYTNVLILIIATAELFKAFEIVNYFFQARVLSKYVVQIQFVINLSMSAIKIGMVLVHASLTAFAWVIVINAALNAAGFFYVYTRREGSMRRWHFKKSLAWSLLAESWPLTLHGVALHTQARIDQVMLGKMLSNYEVGQYSVALKIIEIFGFVPMIIMTTFAPAVTKGRKEGVTLYHSRLTNFYRLMFATFLVMALPLYFLGEKIIVLLYGIEYQAAGILLSLFAIRLFFTNMGVGKSVFIVNESLFKYSLVVTTIGAAVNIGVNYLLIPKYASVGAIVASIVSFTISIFILDLFLEKTRMNLLLMGKAIVSFWKLNRVV